MDTTAYGPTTVLPAQGRRRFQADLRDATEVLQDGLHVRGLWVTGASVSLRVGKI